MSDKAVKETFTVKFSHLPQESQISYHTELEKKVIFYHILTTVHPNNLKKGLFKIFIPSSKFEIPNNFPISQSKLVAKLVIKRKPLKSKAILSFSTINYRIKVSNKLNITNLFSRN